MNAVVSRGGRPDLAGAQALGQVRCPVLLIVGGHDDVVIELNQQADALLELPERTCDRAGRHAPVRRTGHAGTGRDTRRHLVRAPSGNVVTTFGQRKAGTQQLAEMMAGIGHGKNAGQPVFLHHQR